MRATLGIARATCVLHGPYSRMLDLGGVSASSTKSIRRMDASKNCKLQAIAFDFDLLIRTVEKPTSQETQQIDKGKNHPSSHSLQKDATLSSEMSGVVQEMANLLNVKLGSERTPDKPAEQDDLSGLHDGGSHIDAKPEKAGNQTLTPNFSSDIRAKYAVKLKNRGGLAGVDLAKYEVEENLKKGDATGHLVARTMMSKQSAGETKWMALTGTGTLLNYISNRTMKIALLPIPKDEKPEIVKRRMQDFAKQLPHVSFDMLKDKGDNAAGILKDVEDQFQLDPLVVMVVSDRDDYLRAAKEAGMVTCRIRPKNGRRGNTSAHYSSETIAEVKDVVDEINGISYQAVSAAGA